METLVCELPGGYVDEEGAAHRDAELAVLRGRSEEALAEAEGSSAQELTTRLLAESIVRVGAVREVSQALVRRLCVADRLYLLLRTRELTFGSQVVATIVCPHVGCGEKLDVDFAVDAVPVTRSDRVSASYRLELPPQAAVETNGGETLRDVYIRLPNGGDQERLAAEVERDATAARRELLQRCVVSVGPYRDDLGEIVAEMPEAALAEIEAGLSRLAPRVELNMESRCPACAQEFTIPFDLERFIHREFRISRSQLYREVHYLAYHYHWSEEEIMAMPRARRRTYIAILADEMEGLNHAV